MIAVTLASKSDFIDLPKRYIQTPGTAKCADQDFKEKRNFGYKCTGGYGQSTKALLF